MHDSLPPQTGKKQNHERRREVSRPGCEEQQIDHRSWVSGDECTRVHDTTHSASLSTCRCPRTHIHQRDHRAGCGGGAQSALVPSPSRPHRPLPGRCRGKSQDWLQLQGHRHLFNSCRNQYYRRQQREGAALALGQMVFT